MTEEELPGGNMTAVVRVGDTVRREAGPWTPAVHALLDAWAEAGIAESPRALGFDERGREILSFIDGDVLADAVPRILWSARVLDQCARLLRRLHDASTHLVGSDLVWRGPVHPPFEVICHNDVAPYNLIERDGDVVGIIDADMASPGSRLWDLAYLVYRLAPFAEDADGFDPSLHGTADERMRALVAAYGGSFGDDEVRAMMVRRLERLAEFTDARAAETGRADFLDHASMYRRDAARLAARNAT
ncbi:phosphotransferase [Salinibacterium sp. ZJ70]|uniref:phosphotransferase n=1 Tax=Salinibacterium sp. ZJ70 TaxID=2708084 RepID=UPI001CD6A59A|nr:phosphotransferase [Salinibacterium sp. ZJ70]